MTHLEAFGRGKPVGNLFVAAMPPRKQIAGRPDRKQDLKSWLKREYKDPVKYQANVVRIAQPCAVLVRRMRNAELH